MWHSNVRLPIVFGYRFLSPLQGFMLCNKWAVCLPISYWSEMHVWVIRVCDLEASGLLLFLFVKQEKDQRSLDINTAKCMLGLLLGKIWPLFPVFHQFLEVPNLLLYEMFVCFLRTTTCFSWPFYVIFLCPNFLLIGIMVADCCQSAAACLGVHARVRACMRVCPCVLICVCIHACTRVRARVSCVCVCEVVCIWIAKRSSLCPM